MLLDARNLLWYTARRKTPWGQHLVRRSSAVEQLTVNQLVVGSIPTVGANFPNKFSGNWHFTVQPPCLGWVSPIKPIL